MGKHNHAIARSEVSEGFIVARKRVKARGAKGPHCKHYFRAGYPRNVYRKQDHFVRLRLIKHLKRRSQRAYKKPIGPSWYAHLRKLGLVYLLSLRNDPEPQ